MKLTPFAKIFITMIILAVVAYAAWHYKGTDLRKWATGKEAGSKQATPEGVSQGDFAALNNAPADPDRGVGSTGVAPASLSGAGKLDRPLVVAINTWAGHAPGVVFNGGMDPSAASVYRQRFGLDVKFVLIEDPVEARRVPQGRRRHHVGHRRQLGS